LTVSLFDEPTRVYARPLRNAWLVVGKSLAPEQSALRQLLVVMATTGLVGLLLSVAGGWFLAGRALVPIAESFRRQQEFIADAGHELRTPLTILRSATDLLHQHRDEPLTANDELFDDARHEIGRLERLAGDLLTIAQSDQHSLSLAEADVDLPVLASDLVRRLTPLAQARGVELAARGEKGVAMVEGDPDRLEQVLLILLDNAIKHTPSGGSVTVTVRHQGNDVLTEVADTGEGIPTEHLPRVFDRFYRGDRSRSRADGSTGLGLAIARSLVDAHNGRLLISSSPGNGTRVTIQLRALAHPSALGTRLTGFAARLAHRPTGGSDHS
jgi:two-component system sensor histidine kinase CiaH